MTSPSKQEIYCEVVENVDLYNHNYGNLFKSEINHEAVKSDEKQKDSTLSNLPELIGNTCCNLEYANIADALRGLSTEDNEKKDFAYNDNLKTEMHEHENNQTGIWSLKKCVDLEVGRTCLVEKENELVGGDSNLKNRRNVEARRQELNTLTKSVKKVQDSDKFGIDHISSPDEKPENLNIREFCVSIKPLNTEIITSEQHEDASFKSEKSGCNSVIIGITLKVFELDADKIDGRSQAIKNVEPEMQKEKDCVDTVTSHRFSGGLQEAVSCNTFGEKAISCVDETQNINKSVNMEMNDSSKKNIEVCFRSQMGHFNSEDINISSKNIVLDHERAEVKEKAANNADSKTQKDETIDNSVNDRSCVGNGAYIKTFNDVEINDSCIQNIDRIGNSEKDNFNLDLNGVSLKDITMKDCTKTDLNNIADDSLKENEDFIVNNCGKTESVIQESCMLHDSAEKDQTEGDIGVTIESTIDEKHCIRVLGTNKQDADLYKSSEDRFFSNANVQKSILTEDQRKKELTETLKHPKSIPCSEENCFKDGVSDEISSRLDVVVENVNVAEKGQLVNNGTTKNAEKRKVVNQMGSILYNAIQNEERHTVKTLAVTALPSKIKKTCPEDLDVILISSTEEDSNDFDKSIVMFNKISGENDLNIHVRDKFHEELYNEIEILKAQYSDLEKKLANAKKISNEEKYKFSLKVKKELTSCMQSLEKLSVSLRNKSKMPKEKPKPSCSYHQQYAEKLIETPIDKYKYRSQAFTQLTKISHHHYEFNSRMPTWETVKVSHKSKKRPEQFSGSEEEACKNLHKKKCMSQCNYECGFQQSPEKKIKSCSKKCCLSKNCTSYRKARETEFHSYRNEIDCFDERRRFSKSYVAHRELTFSKSNPRNCTNYLSHSSPTLKMESPIDKYKTSVFRPCSRKKISGRLYGKEFNFHKCGRGRDYNNVLSDSSEISSVSDTEFPPIHSDHFSAHGSKYCKSKHPKSVKKSKVYSRKEKQYETDEVSLSSMSDTSVETSGKTHKEKASSKYDIDNKKGVNLIGRQMDFINKRVSRKGDRIEQTQASFNHSNNEKYRQNYFVNLKNEEFSSSESAIPNFENVKKRKREASELPFKQSKTSYHSDLRNILNNKQQIENSKVKFHSRVASRSRSMSPVETNTSSRCKMAKTKLSTDSQNIFKNKCNTENCKSKLQSYIVSPSVPLDAMKYKNEIDNYSTQSKEEQTKDRERQENKAICTLSTHSSKRMTERNKRKNSRIEDKHAHKIWDDVAQRSRNETDEEYSESEINIKNMESYNSFLKEKKGKYTTSSTEFKYGSDSIDEIKGENKLSQKSRSNLVHTENVPVNAKKTVRSPQISPDMTEQSATQRAVKKKPVEDNSDVPASSGKFDLFKQLNREIRKKNVKKRAPATSTINVDSENKNTFSKQSYPEDDNSSFNKVKGFPKKCKGRGFSTKSKNFLPDFQEDNGTWSD